MWLPRGNIPAKKGTRNGLVAVAIDKDKGSQQALKWAAETLLSRGQTAVLIHVLQKSSNLPGQGQGNEHIGGGPMSQKQVTEKLSGEIFLPFHCYCTRKDIHCFDVVLEDTDTVRALTDYVAYAAIENLVLGSPSKHGFMRRFRADVPSGVSKGAPDFCTVYVISKGKVSSVRHASHSASYTSPLLSQIENQISEDNHSSLRERMSSKLGNTSVREVRSKSPFGKRGYTKPPFSDLSESETDISFVSSDRTSTDHASSFPYSCTDSMPTSRPSTSSEQSLALGHLNLGFKFSDQISLHDLSPVSQESGRLSCASCSYSSQSMEDIEGEMRRLKMELKQTMDLYNTACKEALTANHKAMSMVEQERLKYKAAMEAAEAAKRLAELEAQKRTSAEKKALKECEEMKKVLDTLSNNSMRYRRYTIEEIEAATEGFSESRKIGEGGYGLVYKCYLDHTPVAVKVLRPDAVQGTSQFKKEIEVLSCIRHPNMVLLLGACPEYGILVYEYMAKGSLEDRLFRKGNTPVLSWQLRFQIAADIATGLLFLHQTKPEPLVHRDLKPANILLDQNYVSKISDVGLARLVPAVAENVTQYRMTSMAGTFCYIDPEYQQTGMLGVKSDLYSLGILLLQLLTAQNPMGLAHYVEHSIKKGTFESMLDPKVTDWPVDAALCLAKVALQCAELRRKDRPDLGKVVLPELCKLRELAQENMGSIIPCGSSAGPSPHNSQVSSHQDVMSDPHYVPSESSKTTL
ncbi:U-box domain-containing protein 35-like isoform X2 [Carica papaya]|uniref:U-box domain-containing protein 35-like isoform X2 n=1 Tax=Carica papaya TaxID=3649 RepID=UPI000B8D0C0D|nr:U-box domain-containing protein 35-like isoform X2 [Carica papaya]